MIFVFIAWHVHRAVSLIHRCTPIIPVVLILCGASWGQPIFARTAVLEGVDYLLPGGLAEAAPAPKNPTGPASIHSGVNTVTIPETVQSDQDTKKAKQNTSTDAKQSLAGFYVGIETGVLLIMPYVGVKAGWGFPDHLPDWSIEADYSVTWEVDDREAGQLMDIGLVFGRRTSRGYYFRLGRGRSYTDNETDDYAEIAGGWRTRIPSSVPLRLHIGLGYLLATECKGCYIPVFPFLELGLSMEVNL